MSCAALLGAATLLAGCGGDGATGAQAPVTQTPPPAAAPAPAPPAAVVPDPRAGYVLSPTLDGAAPLAADFPVENGLRLTGGTGTIPDRYGENVGAFRFVCGGEGPLLYDDPLVKFGQPGTSHLHAFWGPTAIDASTTMTSLAGALGNSTCNYGPHTLNRSAYWMPALLDDAGFVRKADSIAVYYKRATSKSPACTSTSSTFMGTCVGLPNQIKFVWGWDQSRPDAPVQGATWYCTGGTGGHFLNLDDLFNSGCKAGDILVADLAAPYCWDGKYLDVPDHRSHLAYPSYGSWGYAKCAASHPYVIPRNESKIMWTVTTDMYEVLANGTTRSRLRLSSDHMKPGAKPGETLHSDYMEQWVGEAKQMWMENCIEKALSCNGGDLGNGLQLIGASRPAYGWTNPSPKSITAMPDMLH